MSDKDIVLISSLEDIGRISLDILLYLVLFISSEIGFMLVSMLGFMLVSMLGYTLVTFFLLI